MARSYRHIEKYEKEILEQKRQGIHCNPKTKLTPAEYRSQFVYYYLISASVGCFVLYAQFEAGQLPMEVCFSFQSLILSLTALNPSTLLKR